MMGGLNVTAALWLCHCIETNICVDDRTMPVRAAFINIQMLQRCWYQIMYVGPLGYSLPVLTVATLLLVPVPGTMYPVACVVRAVQIVRRVTRKMAIMRKKDTGRKNT
jgi:hypothetical protein